MYFTVTLLTAVANIDVGALAFIEHVRKVLGRHDSRSATVKVVLRYD
jgi:hypothetical protein